MLRKQHSSPEAALVDVTDRDELEAWLRERPPAVSTVIAARAALRVLPLVLTAYEGDFKDNPAAYIVLPVLRATATAWFAVKYRNQVVEAAAAAAADAAAADAADPDAAYAYVAAYAAYTAYAGDAANHAATATATAASAIASVAAAAATDIEAIESGTTAAKLAARKLWPKRPPEIARNWSALKRYLLSREGENWEVWTDWYDARLAGRPSRKALEIARVTIADGIWRGGPFVVNAEIRRLIEAHPPLDSKAVAEALKQSPASLTFQISGGKIDAAPENAVPLDKDIADDLYEEAKHKAQALDERLKKIQVDWHLRDDVARFLRLLGTNASGLRPGLLLSAIRSLESDVRAYDSEEGRKELAAGDLSRLVDLTTTARDFIASFPKVREIEAEAVALDLPKGRLDEVETHVGEISGNLASSDGVTEAAKAAMAATVAGVPTARNDLDREKQLAYALLDIGNLARTGLGYVKTAGQKLARPAGGMMSIAGRELGGLGRDSWSGVRKGFPKGVEAGARTAGKSAVVGGIAGLMTLIAGPIAGLATLVSSFAPLGKISDHLSEPIDKASDDPSEDGPPGHETAPDVPQGGKLAAKRRRAKA